jgi:uncharacterized peroxidase-related enzyme
MPRIEAVQLGDASGKARELLEGIQRAMGMVPNLMKTMARSPAVLESYLGFGRSLQGALRAALREQIALTVAGANDCGYCASAHTALGASAGLDADEMSANLRGESADERTAAALRFARAVVAERGRVSDGDLDDVRAAGYGDAEIAEIVAVIALNVFTNYFNHVAGTEIDFPVVDTSNVSR